MFESALIPERWPTSPLLRLIRRMLFMEYLIDSIDVLVRLMLSNEPVKLFLEKRFTAPLAFSERGNPTLLCVV